MGIDVLSHRARQKAARRHHCAHMKRLFDPGAEKPDLVVQTKRLFRRTHGRWERHLSTRRDRFFTAMSEKSHKDV
ncbi:hypothetical protein BRAS3843_1700012 [Bradyrhizobium sp. STM 3843]|nr:hypothetical protein BRAS3843_1700012 [Bradyrhizobium sp. STM 3843]